ncbi:MAG: hypothetical protein Kow0010_21000 [Dehalococcoidia bacterium]
MRAGGDRMGIWDRTREAASRAAAATRRGARRARLEMEQRRIEGRIRRQKSRIGEAVYPLIKAGAVTIDLPEVAAAIREIDRLNDDLERTRREIVALGDGGDEPRTGETS